MKIKKVGIIGRGAVGTLFAQIIQKAIAKENVYCFPGENRYEAYTKEAFYCNGELCDFQYINNNDDKEHFVDLLLIVVKYPTLIAAINHVTQFVKKDTIILCLLNGITSEKIVEETLGKGIVIHSIAQLMDAVKDKNHVTYTKTGEIVIGTKDANKKEALQCVADFFHSTNVPYHIADDIIHDQYSKLMLNCGINQVCAVYNVPYAGCKRGAAYHNLFVEAMKEVQCIAALEGIHISDAEVEDWILAVEQLSDDAMPSMRQDVLAKRYSEVALFSKTIIELSKKHHIEVPINTDLYNKMITLEATY